MPIPRKNKSISEECSKAARPGTKKILIEFTTIIFFTALILFNSLRFLWPENISFWTLPELLLSLVNDSDNFPFIFGAFLSFLTWQIMYFDSAVPGVNPPSPWSPKKYREASGADFHLNYIFSLVVGPVAATFFYAGWI